MSWYNGDNEYETIAETKNAKLMMRTPHSTLVTLELYSRYNIYAVNYGHWLRQPDGVNYSKFKSDALGG